MVSQPVNDPALILAGIVRHDSCSQPQSPIRIVATSDSKLESPRISIEGPVLIVGRLQIPSAVLE